MFFNIFHLFTNNMINSKIILMKGSYNEYKN